MFRLRLVGDRPSNDTTLCQPENPHEITVRIALDLNLPDFGLSKWANHAAIEPMPRTTLNRSAGKDAHPFPLSRARSHRSRPAKPQSLLDAWRKDLSGRLGYSAIHVTKSVRAVEEFVAHSKGEWTSLAVLAWIDAIISGGLPGARKTAQNKLAALRQHAQFLILREELDRNPCDGIKVPRGFRRPGAVPFSAKEITRIIEAAEARERGTDGRCTRFGPLASTVYAFLTTTGLRFGEAKRQRREDVDLKGGTITISADKAKRNDSLPLSRECVAALRAWLPHSDRLNRELAEQARRRGNLKRAAMLEASGGLLFPVMPSHHTLVEDMKAARVPGAAAGKKGEWHRFRKAAITERAKAGASLRELHKFSRHSRVDTTENCYDFATTTQLRETAELLPRLNGFMGSGQAVDRARGKGLEARGKRGATAESSLIDLTSRGRIDEDVPAQIARTPMTQASHIERFGPTRTGGGHAARSEQSASTRRVRVGPKGSKAAGGVSENGAVGS